MSEQPDDPSQEPASGLPEAGWFVDPERPGMLRWWDGASWTEHRVVDPDASPQPATARSWRSGSGQPTATSGWAIAALVFGVLALTPAAIISGIVAKRRIAASEGKLGGDAMATAGIALGIVYSLFIGGLAVQTFIPQDNEPNFRGPQKPIAALVDGVERAISKDRGREACQTLFTPVFARRIARGSGQSCEAFVAGAVGDGDFEARLDVKSIAIDRRTARVEVSEGGDRQLWALDYVDGRWLVDDISS